MLPDDKVKCPATGFSKKCRDIVVKCTCPKFVQIIGADPNTGETVNKHGCIDSFLHMLLIENSLMQRQTGAAVESFRNEMVAQNRVAQQILAIEKEQLTGPANEPKVPANTPE